MVRCRSFEFVDFQLVAFIFHSIFLKKFNFFFPPPFLSSYEVQLESRVRRKGLGKFLIQILQLIANK